MRNLAQTISRELLPRVQQPSQYIGLETNARCPDPSTADLTIAMAFPDAYTIGISHLGSQLLYHTLNDLPNVACDRTYCPLPDAEAIMREHDVPLFGWETRCAISDFDVVGFSLGYELCVTNVLTMLDLAGIPLRSADRNDAHPIIVGGDALADSPEPIAPFFDVFITGDGEEPLRQLAQLLIASKTDNLTREQTLLHIAQQVTGAYVPRFYDPQYTGDAFAGLTPTTDAPFPIHRAAIDALHDEPIPHAPLVPLAEGVHERIIIEVMRGCPNGCRFCQAGAVRLPVRSRPVQQIIDAIDVALTATGYREVSLLSLSTSDYPHLEELITQINERFGPQHVSISLPSLRVDSQLKELPRLTGNVRKGGLTIAAEAGSERLRHAISKRLTEEDMLAGVKAAYEAGWFRVKVYFMVGLPGETPEDIDAIFHLCKRLSDTNKQINSQPGSISASVSWAVPKPHTPMQWSPMQTADYFGTVRQRLRDLAGRTAITFKFHDLRRSLLEAALCRGDRRVADVIEAAWRKGARLDSWDEHFSPQPWHDAFDEVGLDRDALIHGPIAHDAPLPWDHIVCHRSREFLEREHDAMLAAAD
jgi:radical SAM family uncharacterized protein